MIPSLFLAVLIGVGRMGNAVARHIVDQQIIGEWSIVIVNTLGNVVLGFVVTVSVGDAAVTLVGTSFYGVFTTFSSLAVGIMELVETDDYDTAARYTFRALVTALVDVTIGGTVGGLVG